VANQYHGGVAVLLGYTNRVKVLHNDIHDLPYAGVSIGWGWTLMSEDWYLDPDWGLGIRDYSGNNEVAYNIVENTMQTLFDGGAIYSTGEQPGSTIHDNYIVNCGRTDYLQGYYRGGLNPIYYDEGSRYGEAFNNIIHKDTTDLPAIAVAANLDLSRGELSANNNYFSTPSGLYGYGTFYHITGALRWGNTVGNVRIAGDPSAWPARAQTIAATAGVEPVLYSSTVEGSTIAFGWMPVDSELSIDPGNDYKVSDYEEFDTGMWRASLTALEDQTDSQELENDSDSSTLVDLADDGKVIIESSLKKYTKTKDAYQNISAQNDTIKAKATDLGYEDIVFDRNIKVRLQGGYDGLFETIISVTEITGSLTISDGQVIVTDYVIR
jgi:hypothetical protein